MRVIKVEAATCGCAMCEQWNATAARVLEAMSPEAKRDLAAELITSADRAEGYDVR